MPMLSIYLSMKEKLGECYVFQDDTVLRLGLFCPRKHIEVDTTLLGQSPPKE